MIAVVIPAYNERLRLPKYLSEIREYFEAGDPLEYEVLVVDDGSTDDTAAWILEEQAMWPQLLLEALPTNQGKGGAVRAGVQAILKRHPALQPPPRSANGHNSDILARNAEMLILVADADGATPIHELDTLIARTASGADVVCGSRTAAANGEHRERTLVRWIVGMMFSSLAAAIVPVPVKDSQCGFKLFTAQAASHIFPLCRERGYLYDLQALYIAEKIGLSVEEHPVAWKEVGGSKVRLFADSWKMLTGLQRVRREADFALAVHEDCYPTHCRPALAQDANVLQ